MPPTFHLTNRLKVARAEQNLRNRIWPSAPGLPVRASAPLKR